MPFLPGNPSSYAGNCGRGRLVSWFLKCGPQTSCLETGSRPRHLCFSKFSLLLMLTEVGQGLGWAARLLRKRLEYKRRVINQVRPR